MERNEYMWNKSLMSDVKFRFPNTSDTSTYKIIPAHKYVLAVGSPVFYAMFYGAMKDESDIIEIPDSDPDIFLHFLRFLYCDEANFVEVVSAIKVWYLAEKYDVPSLSRECVNFLDGNMDPLRAFDIIPYARKFGDEGLEEACWEVIEYNAEVIADDETFLDIEHEFVLSFLERSHLLITEVDLFNAVDRWAAKQCADKRMEADGPSKRSELGDSLVQKIRFLLMSPKEFSDLVLPKNILTQEEIIDVFTSFYSDYVDVEDVAAPMFEFRGPRTSSAPMLSFTFSLNPLLRTSWQYVFESAMLSFEVSRPILLCGFQFLFNPTATSGCVSVTMWRRGVKMKQLIAKSRPDAWDTDSFHGQNKVFFNRPFTVDAETCYTIEFLGASSHSPSYYVTNDSSGFDTYPDQEDITTVVTLKFCEGLRVDEICLNRPYFGHIEKVLFTEKDCSLE